MAVKKERIAIDVDDVLALSAEGFVEFSNQRWATNFTVDSYTENWTEWWGITHEETDKRNAIIWGEGAPSQFSAVPGSHEALAQLAERRELFVVTSRPIISKAITETWLSAQYGDAFEEIIFAGIYDRGTSDNAYLLSKADILRKIDAKHLIDDQPKHCNPAALQGTGSILFGDYSWNRHVDMHPGVVRAPHWTKVVEHLNDAA